MTALPKDADPLPPADSKGPVPLDEKLYLGFVALGVLVMAMFFTITLVRAHREKAASTRVPARQLGDFTLTNRTGRVVTRADLREQWLVVSFVFTSCGISCLQVNERMAEIQKQIAGRTDVRLVSFSVDPRTDTPASLTKFAERYQADPVTWLFLTGEKGVVYALIENSFLGPRQTEHVSGLPDDMIHSDQIALVDPAGRLRGLFNGLKPTVASEVLEVIQTSPVAALPARQ